MDCPICDTRMKPVKRKRTKAVTHKWGYKTIEVIRRTLYRCPNDCIITRPTHASGIDTVA